MTNYCAQMLRKTIQLVLSRQVQVSMTSEDERREIYYLRLLIIVKEGAKGKYFEVRGEKKWSYSADIARQFEKKYNEYTSARTVAMNMRYVQSKGLVVSTKSRDGKRTLWAIEPNADFELNHSGNLDGRRESIEC